MMFKLMLLCVAIASIYALPAGNDILDKATANDVYANDVAAPVRLQANVEVQKSAQAVTSPPKIDLTVNGSDGSFKPQHATTMFARLIDDIFQIPITVLQSVAKLLTNPFKQAGHAAASPEATSTY